MRRLILVLAVAMGAPFAGPAPAEAQTVVRICAVNNAAVVMRSRFSYNDWRGTRHTSRWSTSAAGQRNCVTLQDATNLRVEVEHSDIVRWLPLCSPNIAPGRNASVFVTGTSFNASCAVEQ